MVRTVFGLGRRGVLPAIIVFAVITAIAVAPAWFSNPTVSAKGAGLHETTASHSPELPNYDIRMDKSAHEKITAFRYSLNRDAVSIADIRDGFVRGEESLRVTVPSLKIDYSLVTRMPEVIGPDVKQGRASLTGASRAKRSDILINFLKGNNDLTGVSDAQIDGLKVFSDYTNPDGNLSFVELNQEIRGIPVFLGEVKAGFTKTGEMIRVINNLAPGLEYESLSTDFRDPLDAVRSAAGHINYELKNEDTAYNGPASNDLKAVFGKGDWATTAEKIYFPTEPGVAVPAWRVLIWQPVNAYYVIVDAASGTMFWRKNITEDQTQSATYNVYTNPNAMVNSADSPAPLSPYVSPNTSPADGVQGPLLARTNLTRIGNEAPYSFNQQGWITDGANGGNGHTDGNAVEAGLDIVAPNGVDAAVAGVNRVFNTGTPGWNPPPGNPPPGDQHTVQAARDGAVIQMFYVMNLYHDELYRLGFTEEARNFQHVNFTGLGVANDRVSAEGQDSSGTNNANFATPADGGRGRMQMFRFTGSNPNYDGTTDVDIIFHEVTHGTSNRLHGNGGGLSLNMSRAMGEGWSDFYAHAMLSEPGDPINGAYSMGGYALFQGFGVVGTQNYYYGIRRFPKAVMAFTGGPLNRPHNPMTFADIDQTQANTSDGAFLAMSGPHISTAADQVHAAGEVWSSALWEIRAKMVQRLGWANGNRRVLQVVTDGMKLAPPGPTFLTERDAIIEGALMSGTDADVADIWAGFAIRGMGFSSSIQDVGTGTGSARVTEAFDLPNLQQTPVFTVSDAPGDGDGFPEPGEPVLLTIPLTNNTGGTATGVTLQVVGGGSANYGAISHGSTVSQSVPFTIPAATPCGSSLAVTFNVNSSLGATSFVRSITIGEPQVTFSENFDGVTAPALPAGWTAVPVLGTLNFATVTTSADTPPNSVYANDPAAGASGTDLTSPAIPITAPAASLSFRHRFDTEAAWDGGVVEISIGAGAFTDIITAGGAFVSNGYNSIMTAATQTPTYVPNPLNGRSGWTGNSGGFITTEITLPPSAAGQSVRLRWRFGADDNTTGTGPNPGWYVDTVNVTGNYQCSFVPSNDARADFDGDGRTDLSVFRPSEGNWYVSASTAGFSAVTWGVSTDTLVPGDYDGDGKEDYAVFRPSANPADADFYVLNSNGFVFTATAWGFPGDIPAVADYDGDGKTDIGIYRAADTFWYILRSSGGNTFVANPGTTPVPADYDGDGEADIIIFTNGTWSGSLSGGGSLGAFGLAGDIPVPGDYDGDGEADQAVFRPSDGTWHVRQSSDSQTVTTQFGISTDVPVPGDYDGDGKEDIAVYRGGQWWLNQTTAGVAVFSFGVSTDQPIPARAAP